MTKQIIAKGDWVELDANTLPQDAATAYAAYKDLYRKAKDYRQAFEAKMNEDAPEGKRMVFGYNFGKLSVALVDASDAPVKAPAKRSLADYLAAQAAR